MQLLFSDCRAINSTQRMCVFSSANRISIQSKQRNLIMHLLYIISKIPLSIFASMETIALLTGNLQYKFTIALCHIPCKIIRIKPLFIIKQ